MTPFFYFYEGVWGQKSSKNKIVHTVQFLTLYIQRPYGI